MGVSGRGDNVVGDEGEKAVGVEGEKAVRDEGDKAVGDEGDNTCGGVVSQGNALLPSSSATTETDLQSCLS